MTLEEIPDFELTDDELLSCPHQCNACGKDYDCHDNKWYEGAYGTCLDCWREE